MLYTHIYIHVHYEQRKVAGPAPCSISNFPLHIQRLSSTVVSSMISLMYDIAHVHYEQCALTTN